MEALSHQEINLTEVGLAGLEIDLGKSVRRQRDQNGVLPQRGVCSESPEADGRTPMRKQETVVQFE